MVYIVKLMFASGVTLALGDKLASTIAAVGHLPTGFAFLLTLPLLAAFVAAWGYTLVCAARVVRAE